MYFLLIKNSKPAISNPNLKWLQDQDLTVILLLTNVIFIISIILIVFYERKTVRYYQNQIAQLEDKSRRVLMNPHFFFNALNGIQGLYVTSGIKATNKYIGKLSKLLRYTLELNVSNFITIEQELDYITNYVELMQFRLDNKFTFWFDYQTKRSLSHYFIPPMLVQPLVENAIIHGLTPLDQKGRLLVEIKEKENNLHILVKDNGIGVIQSKQKQRNNQKKSYGTNVLRERIGIYNKIHKEDIYFFLNHNRTEKQKLNGTEALIILPIFNDKPMHQKK